MNIIHANLWDEHARGRKIVVTTNIGYDEDGYNNMGAGMALQAMKRYPLLPRWYGGVCRLLRERTPVVESASGLVFLPVKPLRPENPALSWDQKADLSLIERGLRMLPYVVDGPVSLALPGAGNGGLDPDVVFELVKSVLAPHGDRFRICDTMLFKAPAKRRARAV